MFAHVHLPGLNICPVATYFSRQVIQQGNTICAKRFFCQDSICIDVTIQQILAASNCPLVRLHGRFMYIKQCIKVNLQKQRAIIANVIFFFLFGILILKALKKTAAHAVICAKQPEGWKKIYL